MIYAGHGPGIIYGFSVHKHIACRVPNYIGHGPGLLAYLSWPRENTLRRHVDASDGGK